MRQADNSLVYGANGDLIGVLPAVENRTAVVPNAISPWMPKATVAIEDRRFYHHGGVDPVGILRALVADVSAGHIVQGGSTITQELVRNLYLSREKTLQRKVVEACLAVKLARTWSKDTILTAYLNDVYYGNHAYGIEAAAETYFSVPASRLTLAQAALLAGLPQAPSYYDPLHNPAAALARRDAVLHALRRSGDITEAQYAATNARSQPPPAAEPGVRQPGAVLRRLRREPAAAGVRRGDGSRRRAEDLHDDPAAPAACCRARAVGGVACAARPGRDDRLDRPCDGSDPRDGGRDARNAGQRVQPRDHGRAPGRVDVQADRPGRRSGRGDEPVGHALPLRAVLLRPTPMARSHVRRHLRGAGDGRGGDAPVGQHGLRAARARRRPRRDRLDGAEARCADAAATDAVARSRHRRGDPPGHGLRIRDAGRRRCLLQAARDSAGRLPRRQDRRRLGPAAADAGRSGLGRRDGHARARGEHAARDGSRCPRTGTRRCRQDGHDRRLRGRLVQRLHALARGDGLDGLSER